MTGTALVKAEKTLVHYNAARTELAKAVKIDEVKHIRDMATAAKVYARQAQDKTMLADATEIKLRAERRVGEMLIAMKGQGKVKLAGYPKGAKLEGGDRGRGRKGAIIVSEESDQVTLRELGLSRQQSSDWQKLAREPEQKFEKIVREAKTGRKKPAPLKREWPDGDAPKPEFDRQVFLFGARDALEIGQTVLDDIADADYPNYGELEDAAQKVVDMWKSIQSKLLKHKVQSNGS